MMILLPNSYPTYRLWNPSCQFDIRSVRVGPHFLVSSIRPWRTGPVWQFCGVLQSPRIRFPSRRARLAQPQPPKTGCPRSPARSTWLKGTRLAKAIPFPCLPSEHCASQFPMSPDTSLDNVRDSVQVAGLGALIVTDPDQLPSRETGSVGGFGSVGEEPPPEPPHATRRRMRGAAASPLGRI